MKATNNYDYTLEESLVWVKDETKTKSLPYVREGIYVSYGRKGKPSGRHVVAYVNVFKKYKGNFVCPRRFWWLSPYDPYSHIGAPSEGVDPRSIKLGFATTPPTKDQYNRVGEYNK